MEAYHPQDTRVRAMTRVVRNSFARHKASISHLLAWQKSPPGAPHTKKRRRSSAEVAAAKAAASSPV